MQNTTSKLNRMLADTGTALNCLLERKLALQAAILVYASIDQLCWLSCNKPEQDHHDFKNWCEKYLLPLGYINCSSADLWGARCSVLHTATAESRDFRKGNAKRIFYTFGKNITITSQSSDVEIISIEKLCIAFGCAAMQYISDISNLEESAFKNITGKAEDLLIFHDL